MTDLTDVTLAVLAGGAGRRMGGPKAWLTIGDQPIASHLHQQINWPGPTMLVTSPGRTHPPGWELFDAECCDSLADEGPLRGIATALAAAATEIVTFIPIDMPALTRPMLQSLVQVLGAEPTRNGIFYSVDDSPKPLPVALRRSLTVSAFKMLEKGQRSLRSWFASENILPTIWLNAGTADVWRNLNEPSDLAD